MVLGRGEGVVSLEDKVVTSLMPDAGGDAAQLSVFRGEEGCRGMSLAETEGDSNKLDWLHGGDFSKSKRSSNPRLEAMSKYCPSTRYVALNDLQGQ